MSEQSAASDRLNDGNDLVLAPGITRVRPDDHFLIAAETDASPMHIGALMHFSVPESDRASFFARIRRQLVERVAATPLLTRLQEAPDGYDSDVWVGVVTSDLDNHIGEVDLSGGGDRAVFDFIAACSMERLDLSRPPFRVFVLQGLRDGQCAIYLKMHHAVADGIGFQTILGLLSDDRPPAAQRASNAVPPDQETWRALAAARFARLEPIAQAYKERRRAAIAGLEALRRAGEPDRAQTPEFKRLSGPTSSTRGYSTVSLPLNRVKALADALSGTVNDIFLALVSEALRNCLTEIDDLPATPIVANSARSYRKPEHGAFGNRIVAMHPHLATHLANPVERLRAIQAESAREMRRTIFDEAMLDAPEQPFGPRDRRARFSQRLAQNARLLPGNITVSNVPGRADTPTYAGYEVLGNFPVPILGSGRFLNVTSRRNADRLDIGVMTDAEKIPDADSITRNLASALRIYEHAAR